MNDLVTPSFNMFRPHGILAKTLYNKLLADGKLRMFDRNQWYECQLHSMPESTVALFLQLGVDDDTCHFLKNATIKSEWVFTQIWHNLARALLSWFLSQTSINGLLGRGSMFVFSKAQFIQLLTTQSNWCYDTLLDLGAGDGATTQAIAPLFRTVYATEVSPPMRWSLQKKGFLLLDADSWERSGILFDVITCLNLLDRCDQPMTLLDTLRSALTPNGKLVVALVLPYQPYVESGQIDHLPSEHLPIQGRTFEEQVQSAIEDVFIPSGFTVTCWSRLPYLCEGDLNQAYYWLDDAIFVLQVSSDTSSLSKPENSDQCVISLPEDDIHHPS